MRDTQLAQRNTELLLATGKSYEDSREALELEETT